MQASKGHNRYFDGFSQQWHNTDNPTDSCINRHPTVLTEAYWNVHHAESHNTWITQTFSPCSCILLHCSFWTTGVWNKHCLTAEKHSYDQYHGISEVCSLKVTQSPDQVQNYALLLKKVHPSVQGIDRNCFLYSAQGHKALVESVHCSSCKSTDMLPQKACPGKGGGGDQSKNSLCNDRTAFLPSSSDTIRDMLFLEAPWLIILTLMPSRPKTLKTCTGQGSSEYTFLFAYTAAHMHQETLSVPLTGLCLKPWPGIQLDFHRWM